MEKANTKIYTIDISCIIQPCQGCGGLYIGNLQSSKSINTLEKFGIKSILTSSVGTLLNHPKSQVPYYLYIPAQDHNQFNISKYFRQAFNFIDESLIRTNVLVHCMAGISRSVCLVLAYFIKKNQITFQQAFKTIKNKRTISNPNQGFIQQLKKLQKDLKIHQKKQKPLTNNNIQKNQHSIPITQNQQKFQCQVNQYFNKKQDNILKSINIQNNYKNQTNLFDKTYAKLVLKLNNHKQQTQKTNYLHYLKENKQSDLCGETQYNKNKTQQSQIIKYQSILFERNYLNLEGKVEQIRKKYNLKKCIKSQNIHGDLNKNKQMKKNQFKTEQSEKYFTLNRQKYLQSFEQIKNINFYK